MTDRETLERACITQRDVLLMLAVQWANAQTSVFGNEVPLFKAVIRWSALENHLADVLRQQDGSGEVPAKDEVTA
jgi:hypothetical protein